MQRLFTQLLSHTFKVVLNLHVYSCLLSFMVGSVAAAAWACVVFTELFMFICFFASVYDFDAAVKF